MVDGRVVLDDSSLTLRAQEADNVADYAVVEEDVRLVNYATYGTRRLAPAKWTEASTALFYRALAAFGTDFSLIALLFPEMQRAHVKRKYHKELKENATKVGGEAGTATGVGGNGGEGRCIAGRSGTGGQGGLGK